MFRFNSSKGIMIGVLALMVILAVSQDCSDPNYIIPTEVLNSVFDTTYSAIGSQQTLIAYLGNPTSETLQNYFFTLLSIAAPLWAMAFLMILLFTFCAIQMCCFHICKREGCGNEITSSTYQSGPIKCLMAVFFILSFVILITIAAAIIVNSGLISAANFAQCNAKLISGQLYNGNNNDTIPWVGALNFSNYITNATINLVNSHAFLSDFLSSNNSDFTSTSSSSIGSIYTQSQSYTCNSSNLALSCPFSDSTRCPSPLQAVFNQQICNSTNPASAEFLISVEKNTNSTTWLNSLTNLGIALSNFTITNQTVNSTVSQVANVQSSLTSYQTSLDDQNAHIQNNIFIMEIVLYVFYALLLLATLAEIVVFAGIYFGGKFGWVGCISAFWIVNFVVGTLIFIISGFLIASSLFAYDTCSAYGFYFSNSTNLNQISFNNTDIAQILSTCYFTNATSVFDSFNNSLNNQLNQVETIYASAIPAASFYTVVSGIETTLANYASFPTTINFVNQNQSSSASVALLEANRFANFSGPSPKQTCNLTRDYFSFFPTNCTPYQIDQTPPANCCILTDSSDFTTIISSRKTLFDADSACGTSGTTYQDNAIALATFSSSAKAMVNSILDVPSNNSNSLQSYENNYFNYWKQVRNFWSDPVKDSFDSFLTPYKAISQNSSCGFVKDSLTAIVDVSCNQMFPYVNGFAIVNIVLAAWIFLIMIVMYFLSTRLEFYGFLDGDFNNLGEKTLKTNQVSDLNEMEMSGRNQDFLTTTDRRNI